ncbi:MAG: phospholipase [Marivirga sp.]|nr:phospholipase [Marivirga sp.]
MAHRLQITEAGLSLNKASKALIMIHGRGASAADILRLAGEFSLDEFYIVAPQATNSTWYPFSFLAPIQQNEPWLSSALDLLDKIIEDINKGGIPTENIFVLGFSQGACLTLELASRNARKWGGIIAFTGGLIGDKIYREGYKGNFNGTKVFIGNSNNDPHVPLNRSKDSAQLMQDLGADVTLKIYPDMPHTINQNEIDTVNALFFNVGL